MAWRRPGVQFPSAPQYLFIFAHRNEECTLLTGRQNETNVCDGPLPTSGRDMDITMVDEFALDWQLAGKSKRAATEYSRYLRQLIGLHTEPTLRQVKSWLSGCKSVSVQRKRAQAVRAFGEWAQSSGCQVFTWWTRVTVPRASVRPQPTVTVDDYVRVVRSISNPRDAALVELLWSTGLRRGELARLEVSDINFADGFLIVRNSKTNKPRIVPLSPSARRALRRHLSRRTTGNLFGLSSDGIRKCLARLAAPPAHAWRRGWAVHALRSGISEASVRHVAGWSSGAMVVRYTSALSGELAVDEFRRLLFV